jgi:hypothetical protein
MVCTNWVIQLLCPCSVLYDLQRSSLNIDNRRSGEPLQLYSCSYVWFKVTSFSKTSIGMNFKSLVVVKVKQKIEREGGREKGRERLRGKIYWFLSEIQLLGNYRSDIFL